MTTQLSEGTFFRQYARTSFQLGQEIGAGGEGQVYGITREHWLAAKIYNHPSHEHMIKLSMMLMKPPLMLKTNKNEIIWPIDGIMDASGQYVGLLMPFINKKYYVALSQVYNPGSRISTTPRFTWKDLLSIAANIAATLAALHVANYVVGDLNESNILVNKKTGSVKFIDCDSMQVLGPDGRTFRCPVGKAEYTPPELQGVAFDTVDRLPTHDNFALAILIFQLLMEGVHPFTGSLPNSESSLPEDNIRQNRWPYDPHASLQPPKHALPLDILPAKLQALMQSCFLRGHDAPQQRPTAQEWLDALNEAQRQLKGCHKNKQHWYSNHLSNCPWCIRKVLIGFDSFTRPVHRYFSSQGTHNGTFSARPSPAVRTRSSRNINTSQQSLVSRIFVFLLSVVLLVVCSATGSGFKTHGTNTLPTPIYTPSFCAPYETGVPPNCQLKTTCPPSEYGTPPDCRKPKTCPLGEVSLGGDNCVQLPPPPTICLLDPDTGKDVCTSPVVPPKPTPTVSN